MLSVQQQPLLIEQIEGRSAANTVHYRPLQPGDFFAVKDAHAALFPIDYDDSFFHKATNALDRIWSCAAFSQTACGEEQLVGFITAKTVFLHECDTTDRQHLGLLSPIVDHDQVLYILTLGVLEDYRHQGIASALIQMVCQHGYDTRCRAVFLHVITYNTAAQGLYSRQGFSCVARLSNFYYIATGRQPDPSTLVYDAYLYVQFIGAGGGLVTPWHMIALAWTPLRSALGRIHSCMPGFCRQPVHQYPSGPAAADLAAAADPSKSSTCSNTVSSAECSYQPPDIQLQIQQPQQKQQQQQQALPWSRYRYRRAQDGFTTFASGSSASNGSSNASKPLILQAQQQQHCQQQQQHGDGRVVIQQQQRQPPQRMLRWLFSGHSRSAVTAASSSGSQRQQRHSAANNELSDHSA